MTAIRVSLLVAFVTATLWAILLTGMTHDADLLVFGPAACTALLLGGLVLPKIKDHSDVILTGLAVLVIVGLSINFIVRPYGAASLNPQNALKLFVWTVLPLICAPYWRDIASCLGDRAIAMFAGYSVIGALSVLYSPVPAYSAACALSLIAYLSFACVLAKEFDEAVLVKLCVMALLPYLIANWLVVPVAPAIALMAEPGLPRLQGLSGQPNNLGDQTASFMCLVIAAAATGYLTRRTAYLFSLFGFVTLLATQSRTALLSVIGAATLVWLRANRLLIPGLVFLGLAAPIVVGTVGLSAFSRNDKNEQVLTLTGRTQLWAFVWNKIKERPLLGHGLNSFQAAVVDEWYGNPDAGVETHNNALSILFSVGLIGFVPVVIAYGVLITRWFTAPNLLRDLFVLRSLIEGVAEASLSMATMTLFLLFLAVALESSRPVLIEKVSP